MKNLIALVLAAVLLSACSVFSFLESPAAQPFDQVAVAVGVDALVGVNPALKAPRAAAIKQIALEVQAANTGAVATLATLESVAAAKIQALQLPPGDNAAAQLLVATLSASINAYVTRLGTNAKVGEVQADVGQVLTWVIAECSVYL